MDELEALLADVRQELKSIRQELKETKELVKYDLIPSLPQASFCEVAMAFIGGGVGLLAMILWRVW